MSDRGNYRELNNRPRFWRPRRLAFLAFVLLLVFLGLSAALLPVDIFIVIAVAVALVPLGIFLGARFSRRAAHFSNVPYGALDTSSRVAMTALEHAETAVEAKTPTPDSIRQLDFATRSEAEVASVFERAAPHLETLDLSELTLGKHWPSVFRCPWPRLQSLDISHTDLNTQGHFWGMARALGGREEKGELLQQEDYATRARLEAWDTQQAAHTQFILRKPFPALEALDVAGTHLGKRPAPVFHASYALVRAMHRELKSPAITYLPLPYPGVPLERSALPIIEFVDFGHLPDEKLTVTCEMPISRTLEGLDLANTTLQKNEVTGQRWRKKKTELLFQWKPDVLKDIRLYYQPLKERKGKALPLPEEPSRNVLAELAPPALPERMFGLEAHNDKQKEGPSHLAMAECIDFSVPPLATHKPKLLAQKVMVLRQASFNQLREYEWRTAVGEPSSLYLPAKKAERREQQRQPIFPVLRLLDVSSNRLSDGHLLSVFGSIARNELPALKTLRVENNLLRDWDTLNAFHAVFEGVNVTRLYETDIVFERPLGHLAYLDLAVSSASKRALVLARVSCRTIFENLPHWNGPGFGLIRNLPALVKLYPHLKPRVFLHLDEKNKRGQALLDDHSVHLKFQPPTSGTPHAALDLAGFQNTVFACTYARFRHLYERYCVEIGPYTSVRSAPYRLEDPLQCVKRPSVQLCVSGNAFRPPQYAQDTGTSLSSERMHRPVRDEKKHGVEKSVPVSFFSSFSSLSRQRIHAVPMACPSYFNEKHRITATQWAVHLVCHRWMPHAMLYLEGTDAHGQRFATRYEARSLGKLSRALTTGCAAWVKISDIRLRDMDEHDERGYPLLEVDDEGRVSDYYHSSWQVTPEQGNTLQAHALADQARAMLGKITFQMLTPGFFSGKDVECVNCLAYCKRLLRAIGIEDIPTHFWPQSAVKQQMRKEGSEEKTPASSA